MAVQETTVVQGPAARLKKFFREVKAELKKVTWPNKQELLSYTGIVFVSVIAVSILIWVVDSLFNKILTLILR